MDRGGEITVVIAEDEFLIAQDVADAAQKAGFRVLGIAPDGMKAIEMVRELSPTVAILDIKMPRLDGLEAARRLHEEHPLPVVLMTAYESREFLEEAKKIGVGAYLTKPPHFATLGRAVELAIARHGDLMELHRANEELRKALEHIETLEGILPICSYCKNIRDEDGQWQQLEQYISRKTAAKFSHGICHQCLEKHHPDVMNRARK